METFTRVNGKIIKLMVMVFISLPMETCSKEIGRISCNMAMEMKSLKKETLKDNMQMVRRMDKENMNGKTDLHTMVTGLMIKSRDLELIDGSMDEYIKDNG